MNNDPLTINGVPILYERYLFIDNKDDSDTIYVCDDDPANIAFLLRLYEQNQSR